MLFPCRRGPCGPASTWETAEKVSDPAETTDIRTPTAVSPDIEQRTMWARLNSHCLFAILSQSTAKMSQRLPPMPGRTLPQRSSDMCIKVGQRFGSQPALGVNSVARTVGITVAAWGRWNITLALMSLKFKFYKRRCGLFVSEQKKFESVTATYEATSAVPGFPQP